MCSLLFQRNRSAYEKKPIYRTEQSLESLEQVNFTNYKQTLEYRLPQFRLFSDEITTLKSLDNGKNRQKNRKRETYLNDRYQNDPEDLSKESGLYESVNRNHESQETEDTRILKIFPPSNYFYFYLFLKLNKFCNKEG